MVGEKSFDSFDQFVPQANGLFETNGSHFLKVRKLISTLW
jgi:hypothetical protein